MSLLLFQGLGFGALGFRIWRARVQGLGFRVCACATALHPSSQENPVPLPRRLSARGERNRLRQSWLRKSEVSSPSGFPLFALELAPVAHAPRGGLWRGRGDHRRAHAGEARDGPGPPDGPRPPSPWRGADQPCALLGTIESCSLVDAGVGVGNARAQTGEERGNTDLAANLHAFSMPLQIRGCRCCNLMPQRVRLGVSGKLGTELSKNRGSA